MACIVLNVLNQPIAYLLGFHAGDSERERTSWWIGEWQGLGLGGALAMSVLARVFGRLSARTRGI